MSAAKLGGFDWRFLMRMQLGGDWGMAERCWLMCLEADLIRLDELG